MKPALEQVPGFDEIVDPLTIYIIDERGEQCMKEIDKLIGTLNLEQLSEEKRRGIRQFVFAFIIDGYLIGREACDLSRDEKFHWSDMQRRNAVNFNREFFQKKVDWFRSNIKTELEETTKEMFGSDEARSSAIDTYADQMPGLLSEYRDSEAMWNYFFELVSYGACVAIAELKTCNDIIEYAEKRRASKKKRWGLF